MINKSQGLTYTEKILAEICDNTFLNAWSFANPINNEKKEFCDLIAIFDNHMFIFFDREKQIKSDFLEKADLTWNRWYREVIVKQINTCNGAERYIKNKGELYIDIELKTKLPITYDSSSIIIHKFVIAHGAKLACELISDSNINGSLGVIYTSQSEQQNSDYNFVITLNRENPIHILDSHNFPIIFSELDTFYDLTQFITAKEEAIKKYDYISYCGEEDLLAHYYLNFNEESNSHFIGSIKDDFNGIHIGEGEWNDFILTPAYRSKKEADKKSYLWDHLIQKTCDNALKGVLGGNSNLFSGESALYEMAKEPRFSRRALSEHMINAINNFPINNNPIFRNVSFMPSFYKNKAYIFLQLKAEQNNISYDDYREVRKSMLEIACGAAKNKFPNLEVIIGIAGEPQKLYENLSEDFILMDCKEWTNEQGDHYKKENEETGLNFFNTPNAKYFKKDVKNFPNSKIKE